MIPYVAYLCGWDRINEPSAARDFLVPELRTRVKAGIVLAVTAVVVQTQRLRMDGLHVLGEEQGDKGVAVEDLRKQRPGYGLRSFACQSYGSALPGVINNHH